MQALLVSAVLSCLVFLSIDFFKLNVFGVIFVFLLVNFASLSLLSHLVMLRREEDILLLRTRRIMLTAAVKQRNVGKAVVYLLRRVRRQKVTGMFELSLEMLEERAGVNDDD